MKENIQAFMVELVRGMILLACIHMVEMMILVFIIMLRSITKITGS